MIKLALVPVLLAIACLCAGLYGALHNQISYTVAPEYFTQFKFHQFRIDPGTPDRIGAAIVGWHAAWWMGVVIGVVLIPMGLVIRGTANYFWGMIRVFGIVAVTTLLIGLVALGVAFGIVDGDAVGQITRYGNEIHDDVAFARAGTMHDFSYLGGLVGIVTGGVAVFWQRRRSSAAAGGAVSQALGRLKTVWPAVAVLAAVGCAAADDLESLSRVVAEIDALHRVTEVPHRMADSTIVFCRVAYNPNIHEGMQSPAYCHVYVTAKAKEPMVTGEGVYPRGSVIVKAKLVSEKSRDAVLYTVMRKMEEGYDTKHGNWEYAVLDGPSKRVLARGRVESCIECHQQHATTDYVTRAYMKSE